MFTAALILTSAVVLSPNPETPRPVARPLCLVNVGANTIVYAGDVKDVRLSADKKTVQIVSAGGKLDATVVPADKDADAYRKTVANSISEEWAACKSFK
jgi:hypothetical protein